VPVPLINSPEDRAWLAKNLYGIDDVIMVPFDREMMTTSWEDFITEILVKRYHAVHLVAGHDHRFGHKNQGSPELLNAVQCLQKAVDYTTGNVSPAAVCGWLEWALR